MDIWFPVHIAECELPHSFHRQEAANALQRGFCTVLIERYLCMYTKPEKACIYAWKNHTGTEQITSTSFVADICMWLSQLGKLRYKLAHSSRSVCFETFTAASYDFVLCAVNYLPQCGIVHKSSKYITELNQMTMIARACLCRGHARCMRHHLPKMDANVTPSNVQALAAYASTMFAYAATFLKQHRDEAHKLAQYNLAVALHYYAKSMPDTWCKWKIIQRALQHFQKCASVCTNMQTFSDLYHRLQMQSADGTLDDKDFDADIPDVLSTAQSTTDWTSAKHCIHNYTDRLHTIIQ